MIRTDKDQIPVTDTDEEVLNLDVSDEALERAAPFIGGQATPVTMVYGTDIAGNCACPV
jgi:D-aminopeptidase